MEAGVEAQDRRAEQPVDDLLAPGADRERLRVRPGNVPEGDDRGARQPLADHARRHREVIVLHQHDRVLALRLLHHGVGEAAVDRDVMVEIALAEDRPHEGDMAQRPQPLVGEAVVIAVLLLLAEPDAAQRIGGIVGRHRDAVVAVDALAVGRARAMRDPDAAAGAHHRLQRRDEAAGRGLQHDLAVLAAVVDVGLAVGDHHHLRARQFLHQQLVQGLRRPFDMDAVGVAALQPQFRDQRFDVARDRQFRLRLRRRDLRGRAAEIGDRGAEGAGPAADQHEHHDAAEQAQPRRDADQRQRHVKLGLVRAALDEGEVVQHQQLRRRPPWPPAGKRRR